jgi:hypothetical protein
LVQAGVFRCRNGYFTFFHDSFESYYAACAIERDVRRGKLDLAKACFGSSHLAETWNFVEELFQATGDHELLKSTYAELSNNKTEATPVASNSIVG